jgi:hypothetical protein
MDLTLGKFHNTGKISQLWNARTEDNVDTKSEKTLPVNQPVQEQW